MALDLTAECSKSDVPGQGWLEQPRRLVRAQLEDPAVDAVVADQADDAGREARAAPACIRGGPARRPPVTTGPVTRVMTRTGGETDCRAGERAARIADVAFQVRGYEPADERSWLHCRALSFLGTAYFDDVRTAKEDCAAPGFGLVAVDDAVVVGVLDVEVADDVATIDTIAVHPDHQGHGIGTALFDQARDRLVRLGVVTVEAWTRDDEPTLRWYRSRSFIESDHYLHVYANYYTDPGEPARAVESRIADLRPVTAFLHAPMSLAAEMRAAFARVHVCRRFSRPLN
jgi:GNAT superfamily N-acetyltransferase